MTQSISSSLRLTAVLLALLPLALRAAEPTLEEQVRQLATEVQALRRENRQLRTDLGLDGRAGQTVIKPAGREPTLSVGGLIQAQADFGNKGDVRFTSANDRFYLRRARLNMQGRFLEAFDFRLEGEFAGSLGEGTGNRAQLTDAFINWNRFDYANVRVGQFKTPFGSEQLFADPKLATIERSLVNDRLTAGRQIGLQLGGDLPDQRVTYAVGIFNGTGVNTSANDNNKFMWVGRASTVAWQGTVSGQDVRWTLGANALTSTDASLTGQPAEFGFDVVPGRTKDNTFAGKREAGGLDAQLHAGRLDLAFEYLRARFKAANRIPSGSFDADGWYAQAAWYVIPKVLQGVVKYDEYDPNRNLAANGTQTWTLGANYFLKADDIKLQLDYLHTNIDSSTTTNNKLMLRLQTVF